MYFGESYAYFTADANYPTNNFGKIIRQTLQSPELMPSLNQVFDPSFTQNMLIVSPTPGEIFCKLMENVQVIIAGGGIVRNPQGELLMIHRKGKWDMPKGKIELKEDISAGALREVEEETNARVQLANPKAILTYHAYLFNHQPTLKETHWFQMKSETASQQLHPQGEEDITSVGWKSKEDYLLLRKDCYRMIRDLADEVFDIKD